MVTVTDNQWNDDPMDVCMDLSDFSTVPFKNFAKAVLGKVTKWFHSQNVELHLPPNQRILFIDKKEPFLQSFFLFLSMSFNKQEQATLANQSTEAVHTWQKITLIKLELQLYVRST